MLFRRVEDLCTSFGHNLTLLVDVGLECELLDLSKLLADLFQLLLCYLLVISYLIGPLILRYTYRFVYSSQEESLVVLIIMYVTLVDKDMMLL